MIDIHSHILNNVDDGSDSLELSLSILKKAENAGFTDVIFTPHYIENYYENNKAIINDKIIAFKNTVYDEEVLVQIYHGNEIMLTENTPQLLQNGTISTLANSKYILFEIPFTNKMLNLRSIIYEIQALGFIPIIAHPERYMFVQENVDNILDLIKQGVLIQSNYGSFIGNYGKQAKYTAEQMLKRHLITFLGSDTHKRCSVYDNMPNILKRINKICKSSLYVDELTTINPKYIINDLDF